MGALHSAVITCMQAPKAIAKGARVAMSKAVATSTPLVGECGAAGKGQKWCHRSGRINKRSPNPNRMLANFAYTDSELFKTLYAVVCVVVEIFSAIRLPCRSCSCVRSCQGTYGHYRPKLETYWKKEMHHTLTCWLRRR